MINYIVSIIYPIEAIKRKNTEAESVKISLSGNSNLFSFETILKVFNE